MKQKSKLILFKKLCFLLVFLLISSTTFSQTKFYQGLLNQTAWDDLITEINTKTVTLNTKIIEAETANLESSYAKGSIVSVSEFVIYATRDREKAATLQTIYEGNGFRGFNNNFESQLVIEGISGSPDYSLFHPYQQLQDCINILDFAIAEIQDQIDGNITLPETLDFSTSGHPQLATDASYYTKGGDVIFPSTFWTMPDEDDLMETIGYLGETFNSPANTQSPGITRPNYANSRANTLSRQVSNNQTPTQVHYTHTRLPTYMTTAYPGIGDHPRAFVHYDIDHPEITNLNRSMISTFNPQIVSAAAGSPLIYVLSNEPHWNIAEGESQANLGVSNNTMDAYVDHLETEYGNDISVLNTVYNPFNGNENFTSFDDLKTEYTIPLNRNIWQGTPIWYDWLRFNMNRSNRWHKNLKTITRESDANANISIKILGREVEDPRRDGGIDLEGLMDMQEVIGFDVQVVPNETHGRNNRFYRGWLSQYIMDWREQSIMLDFSKSLYPNKPTFDSEWHGISSNAWDNFRLDRGYVRSSLWLAFTNGMSVINCWWWYREHLDRGATIKKGDLEGKTGGVGNIMFSPQHQAVSFDTFGRTMKEINAQSNTVASLVPAERDVLIYYSNEAAIQDFLYAQQMSDIYEALKLLNIKVGFTTPSKINNLGYSPSAIVIPPTLFSLDSSIDALNTYNSNNPSVDILQVNRFSGPSSFSKDEKGTDDVSRDLSFANKTVTFTSNISTLINRLRSNLVFPTPAIDIDITEPGTTTEAFGVFASYGNAPNGKDAVSLVNVSLSDREIKLPSSVNYVNLIDGRAISSTHVMKPYDVLLLTEDTFLSINDTNDVVKTYSIYPNPANDVLNIVNKITGRYIIYNVTGAVIKSIDSKEKSFQINVDNLSAGVYFIELPTNKGKQVETIIISN
ncbi:hypothetical protein A8C32_12230 [Flavivirga aquatica]|uniref:Secretion system C-terminal sorting domain-containing protein n=1 Tax=Flavivirga aquatica TaxID=1849968 RepID=A0A1E5TDM4_9FLAO|nr:T9SS type A sorting domain-containing protein [Flavivirga aquatica]OEK09476.1 hypothetical protein A8C32_12230 [Flavivirga aquatica]